MPRQLDPGASPLHFFGSEVRHARTAAGMTQAELGGLLGYDASEVSKVEAGAREPSARFAEGCDKAFPHMNGWFTRFYQYCRKWEGPYPRWFVDWVEAEGQAARLWVWQPLLVPGLLQTAEYARPLFRAWQVADTEEEVELLVAARLDRQRIFGQDRPPSVWAVIDGGGAAPAGRRREGDARPAGAPGGDELPSPGVGAGDPGGGRGACRAAGRDLDRLLWVMTGQVSSTWTPPIRGRRSRLLRWWPGCSRSLTRCVPRLCRAGRRVT